MCMAVSKQIGSEFQSHVPVWSFLPRTPVTHPATPNTPTFSGAKIVEKMPKIPGGGEEFSERASEIFV